jgi:large subunit ribosomal protein L23
MTLIKPVITEKSMMSASRGLYTFAVLLGSTKSQVKEAVSSAFKVKVVAVNILRRHVPGKGTGPKRLMSSSSQVKYATVKLAKGQTIDLFDLKDSN